MKTAAAVAIGCVAGALLGCWLGMLVACEWLAAGSNLCGLVGVFVTGPLGGIAGGVGGWALSRGARA